MASERDSGIWVPPGGSADPPRAAEPPPPAGPPPQETITPEELAEQLRRIRVSDVVLSLLPTLAQLGYAKLDRETRDLDEARIAIDTMRALLPVLEGAVPEDVTRDYRQVVTNMQLAYVSAADETGGGEPAPEAGATEPPPAEAGEEAPPDEGGDEPPPAEAGEQPPPADEGGEEHAAG